VLEVFPGVQIAFLCPDTPKQPEHAQIGLTMPLPDAEIRGPPPCEKPDKLADGGGIYLGAPQRRALLAA